MSADVAAPAERWVVIWSASRAEKRVAARLEEAGLGVWLPLVSERHRWSDRWRNVSVPLFPGYLFARAAGEALHRILRTPGVLTLVKDAGRPAFLSDTFVSMLRSAVADPALAAERVDVPACAPGDSVVVRHGPLAGLHGVVQELRGARRLVVSVPGVSAGVAFTVGVAHVALAGSH